jgi:hypothetical protein
MAAISHLASWKRRLQRERHAKCTLSLLFRGACTYCGHSGLSGQCRSQLRGEIS